MARPTLPVGPLHLSLFSSPLAVRDALMRLEQRSPARDLDPDTRATVLLVLAEVLNNIVEHALTDPLARIEVILRPDRDGLWCCVLDEGLPMPNGALPPGVRPNADPDGLPPEGGYGWFMIRTWAADIDYRREHGRNRLCFRVPAP